MPTFSFKQMPTFSFKRSLILSAVIFALFTVYWVFGQKFIIQKFENAVTDAKTSGYDITHKGVGLRGFPFHYALRVGVPSITAEQTDRPWSFRGDNLYFKASSWAPLHWKFHHLDDARIDMRDPRDQRWLFDVTPLKVDGDIALNLSGGLKSLNIQGRQILPRDVIGTIPPVNSIEKIDISIEDIGPHAHLKLSSEDIFLTTGTWTKLQTVLGPRLNNFSLDLTALALNDIKSKEWNRFKNNGILQSEAFHIQWNALKLSGRFTLEMGKNGLSGPVTLSIENENQLVSAFEKAGLITSSQKTQILFALRLAPKTEKGQREITITLANGTFFFLGQPFYKFESFVQSRE